MVWQGTYFPPPFQHMIQKWQSSFYLNSPKHSPLALCQLKKKSFNSKELLSGVFTRKFIFTSAVNEYQTIQFSLYHLQQYQFRQNQRWSLFQHRENLYDQLIGKSAQINFLKISQYKTPVQSGGMDSEYMQTQEYTF